jgi:uncharacterized repeat protein (TIGR03847 family)
MNERFDLGDVLAFTAGTIGEPGQRVFFLQAQAEHAIVTVKCEKQQVAALGQFLEGLLQDLPTPDDDLLPSAPELVDPVDPVWVAGALGVAWEDALDRFVLVVDELNENAVTDGEEGSGGSEAETVADILQDDAASDLGRLRLELTRSQAKAFSARATELVAAGRPPCRFCGMPIDPHGHACPRMN